MRRVVLGLLAAAALADREEHLAVVQAMRDYYQLLAGSRHTTIESVRDRIVPNFGKCPPDTQKSVLTQINRGFEPKYGMDIRFHAVLCEILAGCGDKGMNVLRNRVKASGKRPEIRKAAAEALGKCGDEAALDPLLQMVHDTDPETAAAAVTGCGAYARVKQEKRKAAMRKLVDRYLAITNDTAGKPPESREMKLYNAVAPAMNAVLGAMSGGEQLDSAKAWDAWLAENLTKPWADPK
jgi:hypothetical protein